MSSPASSSAPTGFSTPWERRLSLLVLSVSWLAILLYLALILSNIVRFFTECVTTTTYSALLAWWFAVPGQTGDDILTLSVSLLLSGLVLALIILLLPATRAILLPALGAALPMWIQQFFIWTPEVRDPGYPRTGTTRAIRALLYVAWVILVAPTALNFGPSLLALLTNGTSPTADNIIRALNQGVFLTLTPAAGLIVFAIEAALTLAAAAALIDWRVEERIDSRHARPTPPQEEYGLLAARAMPVTAIQLQRYVPEVYAPQHDQETGEEVRDLATAALRLAAKRDPAAPAGPTTLIGVCIMGKPMEGKTRLAWEALHAALDDAAPEWTFLFWKRSPTYPFDLGAHTGKRFAIWLNDLQKYAASPIEVSRLQQLLLDLRQARVPVVVIATCRDGREGEPATARFADLLAQVQIIKPRDLTPEQSEQLRKDLTARGKQVFVGDGTPGSVLFSVTSMRERYVLMSQSAKVGGSGARGADAQRLLKSMKLVQSAGTYDFPVERVRAVAIGRFNLADAPGAFDDAVDLLEQEGFTRLRPGSEADTGRLEPVADVYLDQAIPDYPNTGRRMSEDWPRLLAILRYCGDVLALNTLGNAFADLQEGYSPLRPQDLLGNKDAAIQAYEAALSLLESKESPAAEAIIKSNLGVALEAKADLLPEDALLQRQIRDEALAAYADAIRLKPDYADAYTNRGTMFESLKRFEDARLAYEQALVLAPEDAVILRNLADLLSSHLQRFSEALEAAQRAVALDSSSNRGWRLLGDALQTQNRAAEARVAYERALTLNAQDALGWFNRGLALAGLVRFDDALYAYDRSLDLEPKEEDVWQAKATALRALDREAEAEEADSRAAALRSR